MRLRLRLPTGERLSRLKLNGKLVKTIQEAGTETLIFTPGSASRFTLQAERV
ncbi:hypothetical protein [Asticcacaulis sp. MM231]|uniref:hypothetical protein n=1 Tax=Asticcacaulis sp. MM231 TaxID=3157666 RepID=UPI0032D589BF